MKSSPLFEDQRSPSLFEGINARYYRSAEIVKSFIPNEQFENLLVRQHSVVVGPRGSGKTTLLRMLHPDCLQMWQGRVAERLKKRIEFTGIYVATDRVWRQQADAAAETLSIHDKERYIRQVISIDVMAAMARTLESRIGGLGGTGVDRSHAAIGEKEVAQLIAELSAAWEIQPKFLDFGSLRVALRKARIAIRQLDPAGIGAPLLGKSIPWDEAVLLAVDAYEGATGVKGELWALLFDELEIVPQSVRNQILGGTRGMDPRLLIKCSLSPWLQDHTLAIDDHDGTVFNDYKVIKLFYGRRSESYRFSRRLISGRLKAAGIEVSRDIPVEELVFGSSAFSVEDAEGKPKKTAAAYGEANALGQVIRELVERDPDFADWLSAQGFGPDEVGKISEARRAQTVRKARNIMIARLEFRKTGGREVKGRLRSRKTMAMYAGGATMLDICEGNPRFLLGLLVPLLEYFDGTHPISPQYQAEALEQIADDFYALIDAIPVTHEVQNVPEFGGRGVRSPYRELFNRIADHFQEVTLRGRFDPQPPSTFRVPRDASDELQVVVGRLINMGAIVIVPDRGVKDVLIGRFDQNRLRLCYLIAAREHLPPNVDRPISIRRILSTVKDEDPDIELPGMGTDR